MKEYRIYIVDDDEALCEALSYLLRSENLRAECFQSAQQFLDGFDPRQPAVLILDVRMRGMDGLALQQRLADRGSRVPIIILTGHGDVPMAVKAMKNGAADFLQKPVSDQALFKSVYHAIAFDRQNRESDGKVRDIHDKIETLTKRENEVMSMVVEGMPNKQIAETLGISEKTVEVHRKHVMNKMSAGSSIDLVSTILWYREHKQGNA